MNRRDLMTLIGGAVALPVAARAQQGERMLRIGALMSDFQEDDALGQALWGALLRNLQDLGWAEGRNLKIDRRWPSYDAVREKADAAELVGLNPDLIVAAGASATAALARITRSTPIVQVAGADPVALGFAKSLAAPGGNVTGFSAQEPSVSGKWIEVLNEIAPKLSRAMVIQRAGSPNRKLYFPRIEEVARERNMRLTMPELQSDAEIDRAIAEFAAEPAGGLIVLPGSFTTANRDSIISLAAGHRLPAVYPFRNFVEAGGLVSYGIDTFEVYRRSASYIDRILRGAKPADLPIQLPTKFELIVNLRTAKGLGLTIPTSLLTRADEVIE